MMIRKSDKSSFHHKTASFEKTRDPASTARLERQVVYKAVVYMLRTAAGTDVHEQVLSNSRVMSNVCFNQEA